MKRFKHTPFQTTESKCFAENWICATVPQEIDHNSKSIYPTYKTIISPDREEDGFPFDIKLHTENCLYQKQLYKNTPKTPEKYPEIERYCSHRISRVFLDKIHLILLELT